jgi:hypothetical protein
LAMSNRFMNYCVWTVFVAWLCLAPVHAGAQRRGGPPDSRLAEASAKPTPRASDGHPDLSGVWGGGFADDEAAKPKDGDSVRVLFPVRADPNSKKIFDEMDRAAKERQAAEPNKPPYKPELAAKVQEFSNRRQFFDPSFFCKPNGVPRMGAPSQIVQTPGQVVLLYAARNTFRVIPTDGRPHRTDQDSSYMGDSVGHWDGDTLVVDVTTFTDESWLGADGWFHSDAMHVVERYRRNGNTLTWAATVEDPNVFTKPWNMTPRTVTLNPDPKALLEEDPPCSERDASHIVTDDHH